MQAATESGYREDRRKVVTAAHAYGALGKGVTAAIRRRVTFDSWFYPLFGGFIICVPALAFLLSFQSAERSLFGACVLLPGLLLALRGRGALAQWLVGEVAVDVPPSIVVGEAFAVRASLTRRRFGKAPLHRVTATLSVIERARSGMSEEVAERCVHRHDAELAVDAPQATEFRPAFRGQVIAPPTWPPTLRLRDFGVSWLLTVEVHVQGRRPVQGSVALEAVPWGSTGTGAWTDELAAAQPAPER